MPKRTAPRLASNLRSRGTSLLRIGIAPASFLLLATATVLLAACPGSLENKAAFQDGGTCGNVPATIIGPRCATSNCHDADQPQSNIDMTPDAGLAARMVGVSGDLCAGFLIDPSAPEQSLIYTKCLATNSCNARMPFSGTKLSPDEEQCLLEWVTEVAGEATGGATTSSTTASGGGGGVGGAGAGGKGGAGGN